jgi:hypothetical protein
MPLSKYVIPVVAIRGIAPRGSPCYKWDEPLTPGFHPESKARHPHFDSTTVARLPSNRSWLTEDSMPNSNDPPVGCKSQSRKSASHDRHRPIQLTPAEKARRIAELRRLLCAPYFQAQIAAEHGRVSP